MATLTQINQQIASEESANVQLSQQIAAEKTQITQLQGTVSTLRQQLAAAQAAYQRAHPTVTGYGPWSACGSDGQQTRTVYWSNGTTTQDTQSCTPPVTCYTYDHFAYFSSSDCLWHYDVMQKCSNGNLTQTGTTTETDPNCTVSSHPGGGIHPISG